MKRPTDTDLNDFGSLNAGFPHRVDNLANGLRKGPKAFLDWLNIFVAEHQNAEALEYFKVFRLMFCQLDFKVLASLGKSLKEAQDAVVATENAVDTHKQVFPGELKSWEATAIDAKEIFTTVHGVIGRLPGYFNQSGFLHRDYILLPVCIGAFRSPDDFSKFHQELVETISAFIRELDLHIWRSGDTSHIDQMQSLTDILARLSEKQAAYLKSDAHGRILERRHQSALKSLNARYRKMFDELDKMSTLGKYAWFRFANWILEVEASPAEQGMHTENPES